jgi:hypothetical protein
MTDVNLKFREEKRLRDIARFKTGSYAAWSPVATQSLVDLGLVEYRGREYSDTGRLRHAGTVHLTDAGRAWLKANP